MVGPGGRCIGWTPVGVPEFLRRHKSSVAFARYRRHSFLQTPGQGAPGARSDSGRRHDVADRARCLCISAKPADCLPANLGFEWTDVSDRICDAAPEFTPGA